MVQHTPSHHSHVHARARGAYNITTTTTARYLLLIFSKTYLPRAKEDGYGGGGCHHTTAIVVCPDCSFFTLGGRRPLITRLQRQCARVCGLVRLYTPSSSSSSCATPWRLILRVSDMWECLCVSVNSTYTYFNLDLPACVVCDRFLIIISRSSFCLWNFFCHFCVFIPSFFE